MAVSQTLSVTEVANSQVIASNTSKVRILWKSIQSGESWNGYTKTAYYYVSINGGAEQKYSVSYTLPKGSTATILDKTITVTHKDNGSGTVKVRTWMDTGISAGVIEKTTTLTLATIPRASALDYIASNTGYFDGIVTYKFTPKSASYYNRCCIYLNLNGKYIAVKNYTLGKKAVSQWTESIIFTSSELETIYNNLTATDHGTLRLTLRTYSDSEYSLQVGSDANKEITLYIPENEETKPTVTMTLAPVSTLSAPFDKLYINGRTKVDASFTGSEKFGANIISYTMTVNGKSYSSPYTSDYLTKSEQITVVGTVTDSRGFSNTDTKTIDVIDYRTPSIIPAENESEIICARCDENGDLTDSGTYLKIKARRNYRKVIAEGIQNNFCEIRYRVRSETESSFPDNGWVTILSKTDTSTDTIDSEPIKGVVSSAQIGYFVQIGVVDDLGESDSVIIPVPSDFTTVDIPRQLKGRRIGLLRYAKDIATPGIDVGAPIYGGCVDSLKLGELLVTTQDVQISLDDIKTPGCYYSPNADTTQYISGLPDSISAGFKLEVRELQSESSIRQTLSYGATTWIRHWDGAAWSEWMSLMLTPISSSISCDFPVEIGTSGIWTYQKWYSGFVEMWGIATLNSFGDSRHIYTNASLPFAFTNYPVANMTLYRAEAFAHAQGAIVLTDVYTSGATTIRLAMIRNEGGLTDGKSVQVNVMIKGRWK